MRVTIYDLAPPIINPLLQTLTLCPKSPVFKLRFHNSNSRLRQLSNTSGPCLYTRQLFTVSEKAVSMPDPTTNTPFRTLSRFGCLRTFGTSATRAFRHRLVPAITVDSGSRQDLRVCGSGGAHTTSRSKTIFGITGGVWNAPT